MKLTFAKGASLKDPAHLFNSSLEGNARPAIDIHEGEEVDAAAFQALVREAAALNGASKAKPSKKAKFQPVPESGGESPAGCCGQRAARRQSDVTSALRAR